MKYVREDTNESRANSIRGASVSKAAGEMFIFTSLLSQSLGMLLALLFNAVCRPYTHSKFIFWKCSSQVETTLVFACKLADVLLPAQPHMASLTPPAHPGLLLLPWLCWVAQQKWDSNSFCMV